MPVAFPQDADEHAKAVRLAHAQRILHDGAMSGPADLAAFRSDMHEVARRVARAERVDRPASVPSCGDVTGGRELSGPPAGWKSKLPTG